MSLKAIFGGLDISASGMEAMRTKQNVVSANLANAETTRTAEGGPYKRQFVVLEADTDRKNVKLINGRIPLRGERTNKKHFPMPPSEFPQDKRFFGSGVSVSEIRQDSRPPKIVYDPSHPDADNKGYVAMPNINIVKEMADMISASRAYEANVTAFNATKSMLMQAIKI